ncbi:MAG: hypothetical protein EOM87_09505, partial [Clostridia bacterium]|nr:hypothetical protein [Clostridia bacterium]
MTLYAKWAKITYNITYSGVPANSQNYEQYRSYNVESNYVFYTEYREGYTFGGFDKGSGNIITAITPGTIGDLTLTAVWTPIQHNLSYYYNGGTAPTVANPATFNIESVITLNPPTRLGYSFTGWMIDGTSTVIQNIAAGYNTDMALTAQWTIINYTITYVLLANEEIVGIQRTTYKITDLPYDLSSAVKTNYAFAGWYKDEARTVPMPQSGGVCYI